MYRRLYFPPEREIVQHQTQHKRRVQTAKSRINNTSPPARAHIQIDAKGDELAQLRATHIDRENNVLLRKLQKIGDCGSGTEAAGGPPLAEPSKPVATQLGRKPFRRKQLEKITVQNRAVHERLQSVRPFYKQPDAAQRSADQANMRRQCEFQLPAATHRLSTHRKTGAANSRRPLTSRRRKDCSEQCSTNLWVSLAGTRQRQPPTRVSCQPPSKAIYAGVTAELAPFVLSRLKPPHLQLLLQMKRPPEVIRRVLGAVLLLCAPPDESWSEADCSWAAVQSWATQLGGAIRFVANLKRFGQDRPAAAAAVRCAEYLKAYGLRPASVASCSQALAALCGWVWKVCAAAAPEVCRLWQQMSRADTLQACEANEANEANYSGEGQVTDDTAGKWGGSGDALREFCTGHAEPDGGEAAQVTEDAAADVAAAKAAAKAVEDSAAAKAVEDSAATKAVEDSAAAKAVEDSAAAARAAAEAAAAKAAEDSAAAAKAVEEAVEDAVAAAKAAEDAVAATTVQLERKLTASQEDWKNCSQEEASEARHQMLAARAALRSHSPRSSDVLNTLARSKSGSWHRTPLARKASEEFDPLWVAYTESTRGIVVESDVPVVAATDEMDGEDVRDDAVEFDAISLQKVAAIDIQQLQMELSSAMDQWKSSSEQTAVQARKRVLAARAALKSACSLKAVDCTDADYEQQSISASDE